MRRVPCLLACLITTALPIAVALADSATAHLQVTARVLPHVRLEPVTPATPTVTVTAADLERGYLDVAHRYALRTNAPDRVRLQFFPLAAYAQAVEIDGFGAPVRLHDEPVELAPAPGREVAFGVRLWLAAGLEAGDYPAPVRVVAVVD